MPSFLRITEDVQREKYTNKKRVILYTETGMGINYKKFFLFYNVFRFFLVNLVYFIFFLGFFNLFELKNYTIPHGLCFVDTYDTTTCIEKKK